MLIHRFIKKSTQGHFLRYSQWCQKILRMYYYTS